MRPVTNPRKEDIKKIKIKQGSLFYQRGNAIFFLFYKGFFLERTNFLNLYLYINYKNSEFDGILDFFIPELVLVFIILLLFYKKIRSLKQEDQIIKKRSLELNFFPFFHLASIVCWGLFINNGKWKGGQMILHQMIVQRGRQVIEKKEWKRIINK